MIKDIHKIDRDLRGGRAIGPLDKLLVYQLLNRVWRRHLNPYEIAVMTYFVDRAVGWGRNHFTACHANILYGTDDYSGIGLKERTYFKTLNTLEEKGLVTRKKRRDRVTIVVNVAWRAEEYLPEQTSTLAA